MALETTALRLTGRDVLSLLHRTTSNALADLAPGTARATLFCDFRGRLLHRAVVTLAPDGAVWLLRADAPGAGLAAAVDRMVFRDDVHIEDRSAEVIVRLVADDGPEARAEFRALGDGTPGPERVWSASGCAYATGPGDSMHETERIAALIPRHGHELTESFNPFEIGLATEVHLAKGCFTGQESLQRLITYESVRRRPALVHLPAPRDAVLAGAPREVFAAGERAGLLTSIAGLDGFAVLRNDALERGTPFMLDDGTPLTVVVAPEPARPLGR